MKKLVLVLALVLGLAPIAELGARADVPAALLDAGVGSGSGSGSDVVIAHVAPAAPALGTIHDPSADPLAYLSDLENAKQHGWPLAVLVGAFGLVELLAMAGKKWPSVSALAWLGRGRISIVIGGATALLVVVIKTLAAGGSWLEVGAAVIPAVLLYIHPAGTDPAKA